MSSFLTSWVWTTLKHHGGALSLAELEAILLLDHEGEESLSEALDLTLDQLVTEGYLIRSQRDGWTWYSIRFFLDPAIDPAEVPGARFYEYEKILECSGSPEIKVDYDSPLIPYLPEFNQGGVPDCVGHAGALAAQANYLAVTGDRPESTVITRDQVDKATGMIYDRLFRTVFSPWWIYCLTRRKGHIIGDGSRTALIPEVLKETGGVTWDKVLTPKTTDRAPEVTDETIEALRGKAAGHRITGYAKITTWEGLLQAISTHGGRGIVMPINLWEDYLTPLSDGTLRYSPGKKVAGAHSLWWGSYRDGKIIALNSWGSFLRDLKITREYWEKMAGAAFVVLDEEEAKIAKELYTLTQIETVVVKTDGTEIPLTCSRIMVDRDKYLNTGSVAVMLEAGREYTVRAEAPIIARVEARVLESPVVVPEGMEKAFIKIRFKERPDPFADFWRRMRAFFNR